MIAISLAASVAVVMSIPASAQDTRAYQIDEQDLADALREFARISGREVLFDGDALRGKRSRRLDATLIAEEALRSLIDHPDLMIQVVDGSFVVRPILPAEKASGDIGSSADIVVTGTRLRDAPVASPVIRLDREAISSTGITNMGDAIRALPQSFGGGQNLGVGLNVPSENGANVGGGSSANLRGLGSDATLTLLNGHRLPYGAARQSVDLSAIPFIAVDRIEVVADGASALYGSDAVAGVVNVILRRDFDGVEGTAEVGQSTDGGNFTQRHGAIGGAKWEGGGAFAAYEFGRSTPIQSSDRSYSAQRSPGLTLFPGVTKHNIAASGHQRLGASTSLAIDAIFNHRRSGFTFAPNAAGDPSISRGFQTTEATSFAVAPRLEVDFAGGWRASALATFGKDRVDYEAANFVGSTITSSAVGCYCNTGYSTEVGADGTLFSFDGRPVKLAVGTGYRRNDYESFRGAGDRQNIDEKQEVVFGYGELSAPLLVPEDKSSIGYRLHLSVAGRYEHYARIGGVLTPKLGIIYSPVADVDLKASWGKSFRAPTFIQQFQFQQGIAVPAAALGGTNLPPGALVVALLGGNRTLSPETATNHSASVAWRPRFIRGLSVELTYFSTNYVDRIVNPVTVTGQALSNPVYRDYVSLDPTLAEVAAAVNAVDLFIDGTGGAFDPQRVVAIVDSRNVNAGQQTIRGLDMLLDYRAALIGGEVGLTANASYLESERRLTPDSGTQQLAGTLFNPPHFRARATVSWRGSEVHAAATVSRIGGVQDIRVAPAAQIGGMTTLDLNLRYTIAGGGRPSNIEIFATALNLLNDTPSPIRTTFFTDTPYDSTNYSPVGRYLSIGVTAKW